MRLTLLCVLLLACANPTEVVSQQTSGVILTAEGDSARWWITTPPVTPRFDSVKVFWKKTQPPPTPTITAISVSPKTASVETGKVQGFSAVATWSDGSHPPATFGWAATGGQITQSGSYTAGQTAGSFLVIVATAGRADTAKVTVTAVPVPPDTTPPPATRVGWYVSSNGSGTACTKAAPCMLSTAYTKPVQDTTWFTPGSYTVTMNIGKKITWRALPGPMPKIQGWIEGVVGSTGSTIWGFDWTGTSGSGKICLSLYTPGWKLINNYVHNCPDTGIGVWLAGQSGQTEINGNIVVRNGSDYNLDHGMYTQYGGGRLLIKDDIIAENCAFGIHAWSSDGDNKLNNIELDGIFAYEHNGGQPKPACGKGWDIFIGGGIIRGFKLTNSVTFRSDPGRSVSLGYPGDPPHQVEYLRNDLFVGNEALFNLGQPLDSSGVRKISVPNYPTSGQDIIVRPNDYEKGRAHVAVFNWSGASSATANVPGLAAYEVRRAVDFSVVATGTGPTVTIPMNGRFDAFVILPK